MFSTNLKRSVATLGVMAGLLAAAGPASAQIPPTTTGYTPPVGSNKGNLATDLSSEVDNQMKGVSGTEGMDAVSAPANTVFTSVSNVFKGEMIGLEPDYALGTQVGSEGLKAGASEVLHETVTVKAPANAGTQVGSEGGDGFLDIGTTETLDMNAIPITADAGSGNDNLRGEAIDIIP